MADLSTIKIEDKEMSIKDSEARTLIDEIKQAISDLKSNFQAGVDSIYNAIVAQGTTPASKSLSDVSAGISTLSTARYNAGVSATKKGTASAAQVLSGYTFTNSSSVGASGSMTNRGAVSSSIYAGSSYTIPSGYHNGSGKITASGIWKADVENWSADAASINNGVTLPSTGTYWYCGSKYGGYLQLLVGGSQIYYSLNACASGTFTASAGQYFKASVINGVSTGEKYLGIAVVRIS